MCVFHIETAYSELLQQHVVIQSMHLYLKHAVSLYLWAALHIQIYKFFILFTHSVAFYFIKG